MLVLSRKPGENVLIGNGITMTVVGVIGNRVKIAFDAPAEIRILRTELACWHEEGASNDEPARSLLKGVEGKTQSLP